MNITFVCQKCQQAVRVTVRSDSGRLDKRSFACPHCREPIAVPTSLSAKGYLDQCLVCGCRELFVRKDFSQRLGIAIVVIGFLASSITWGFHMIWATYAILFGTALVDVILYMTVGNLLQCYRCLAKYRGLPGLDRHEAFRLETHERFRQQAARE